MIYYVTKVIMAEPFYVRIDDLPSKHVINLKSFACGLHIYNTNHCSSQCSDVNKQALMTMSSLQYKQSQLVL